MTDDPKLTIAFLLPMADTLSANGRVHWAVRARKTKALRFQACLLAATESDFGEGSYHRFDRARLVVRIGWPDKRRRDAANLSPTLKAIIDGFVDGGLLPDDNDRHLVGPDLRPYVAGERGFVRLDFDFHDLTDQEENE